MAEDILEAHAVSPLWSGASSHRGCFASVTVAGVVPAPPEVVFRLFADPAANQGCFSNVKPVHEVGRTRAKTHSATGHVTSEVTVEQVARVRVLRVDMDAPMRIRLDCNHTLKQVRLHLLKGNPFMKSYEGTYTVLGWPLAPGGSAGCAALPEGLAEALPADAWRQVAAKLAARGGEPAALPQPGHTPSPLRQRQQQRQQQQSLVIMHQLLHPALRPPPGLGGMVGGQVRRQFERFFSDLHRACCQASSAAQPAPLSLAEKWEHLRASASSLGSPPLVGWGAPSS